MYTVNHRHVCLQMFNVFAPRKFKKLQWVQTQRTLSPKG